MSNAPSPSVEVLITVVSADLQRLPQLLIELSNCGLCDAQEMPGLGLITGRCSPQALARLRGVGGVQAIEAAGSLGVAPPDNPTQ